jgi:hypothetical protein
MDEQMKRIAMLFALTNHLQNCKEEYSEDCSICHQNSGIGIKNGSILERLVIDRIRKESVKKYLDEDNRHD